MHGQDLLLLPVSDRIILFFHCLSLEASKCISFNFIRSSISNSILKLCYKHWMVFGKKCCCGDPGLGVFERGQSQHQLV